MSVAWTVYANDKLITYKAATELTDRFFMLCSLPRMMPFCTRLLAACPLQEFLY